MKLTIRRNDPRDDLYYIERAEHDGRRWEERTQWGTALCTSARICGDACGDTPPGHSVDVEGSAVEMLSIADAIELRGGVRFRRCAIDARTEPVIVSRPRGDQSHCEITYAEALDLAHKIRAMLV
jgi:hypothetical protein